MRRCLAAVVRLPLPLLLLLAAVETASGFSFSAVPNASWFISKARHGVREFVGKTPSTFAGKTAGSYSNEAGFRWLGLMSGSSDDVEIPEEHVLQVKIATPPPQAPKIVPSIRFMLYTLGCSLLPSRQCIHTPIRAYLTV